MLNLGKPHSGKAGNPGKGPQSQTDRITNGTLEEDLETGPLESNERPPCLCVHVQEEHCVLVLFPICLETFHASWRPPAGPKNM